MFGYKGINSAKSLNELIMQGKPFWSDSNSCVGNFFFFLIMFLIIFISALKSLTYLIAFLSILKDNFEALSCSSFDLFPK